MDNIRHNPIRDARHKAGLTMQQVADALGIHESAVGQWEMRNKPTRPAPENAVKLTRLLPGLTLDQIYASAA